MPKVLNMSTKYDVERDAVHFDEPPNW